MNLAIQEQAIAIGVLIPSFKQELVNQRIDKSKIESAILVFNELEDNTTPRQKRDAVVSLLNKTIDEFLVMDK
ncbi:hypothetical protein ORM66_00500 [Bacillus cereus]|uniref:hypothetical protein n=1 Tax=Bacillus cereus TaxID=1396 RepID=UPI002AC1DD03|nr:hypothetical protein [Bacillus cereus]MDZ4610966.1 hypothetical protein [Bacillus cereus]